MGEPGVEDVRDVVLDGKGNVRRALAVVGLVGLRPAAGFEFEFGLLAPLLATVLASLLYPPSKPNRAAEGERPRVAVVAELLVALTGDMGDVGGLVSGVTACLSRSVLFPLPFPTPSFV